jgi:glycosyltransferase involved in cell wall biosynthesis
MERFNGTRALPDQSRKCRCGQAFTARRPSERVAGYDAPALRIICPVSQRIPSKKAHDKLIVRTCAALARLGARVVLLAPDPLPSPELLREHYGLPFLPPLELVAIPATPRFLYRRRLVNRARALDADAIYVSELKVGAAFEKKRGALGAPLFYEAHTLHRDPRESRLFAGVDAVLTTVETLASRIEEAHPETAPIFVAPLASGWEAELEIRPPSAEGGLHLGYVGQLYPLQGVDVLLEALALLPEFRMTIVGGKDLELELLRARSRRLGLEERLTLKGYVEPSAVRSELERMDVLLLPSRAQERMPFVAHTKAFEYMAMRRAIIAADLPSLREELSDAAIFVAPEDPISWSAAIRKIAEDSGLALRLADSAFARARLFTWENRAKAMLDAIAASSR